MYAKVFASLWKGSLHGSGPTWAVFVYLLAHADPDGVVEVVPEAIRDDTGFGLETVANALATLQAPDERSRSTSDEGRRIIPLDERGWGWQIVNYSKYRSIRDADDRRAQTREAVRKHREKKAAVSQGKPRKPRKAHTEAEADTEAEGEGIETKPSPDKSGKALVANRNGNGKNHEWQEAFDEHFWPAFPKKVDKELAVAAWGKIEPQTEDQFNAIMDGLQPWLEHWQKPDREILYAVRWLKRRRWEVLP